MSFYYVLCMGGMHHGGSDFRAVVPMAGKPRMGTASFSRWTLLGTLPNNPCPLLAAHRLPPVSPSGTMPLYRYFFEGGGWSRWSTIPTFIRVTRPRSIEPAKLIGIRKRISGSSHHVLPQSGLICKGCICGNLQRPVIRPGNSWVKKGITPKSRVLLFLNIAVDATPVHDAAKGGGQRGRGHDISLHTSNPQKPSFFRDRVVEGLKTTKCRSSSS
ncbi:hypothetical protein F4774DRAFT_289647 [Daldinia eschscholtzii]|nr:hypothetical protein F4774DRAFT_289647 [Daldinia eschscholtzii]